MVATTLRCGASSYQCQQKFMNLRKKYNSIVVPPTGEGSEKVKHPADDWEYYDEMHKFISARHTVTPLFTIQSATFGGSTPSSSKLKTQKKNVKNKTDAERQLILTTAEEEPSQQPTKKERVPATVPDNDSAPGLVAAIWREDIEAQAEDQAEDRATEQEFINILRDLRESILKDQ